MKNKSTKLVKKTKRKATLVVLAIVLFFGLLTTFSMLKPDSAKNMHFVGNPLIGKGNALKGGDVDEADYTDDFWTKNLFKW